ncbi:MAG: Asp-tRNA(Asn)/Glu-tRNA(Gln) amidotransferase subunit GatA [Myxococcota bacterium]|nr:Asp-tRNA(Asn)/Glu-tRNA(Gln) amidotransferase subunit GatA [Myxococcota bacterium]
MRQGSATSASLVEEALTAAASSESLNIFVGLDPDGARAAAARADAALASGQDLGPLHGIPIAIKDNICTAGLQTTCSSRFLEGFVPPDDAEVVHRLRAAGAVVLGKTNCDEFAMGSSNENSAMGPVRNPRDATRVPGGSSGGSAAAVAAGIVPLSLGSDTGGSVRQPASLCGVVGIKPTWGRVSRRGLVAFGSSLDQVGPFGSDVAGAAALLSVIAGPDPLDSTCASDLPSEDLAASADDGRSLRIGIPQEYIEGLSDEVRSVLMAPLEGVSGVEIVPVSLPHTRYAIATYYVLASAEASSNLARFDGVRYGQRRVEPGDGLDALYVQSRSQGFGPEVQRRIMLGTFVLSSGYYDAYYGKAQAARRVIREDFAAAFEQVDLIASLTSPTTAFPLGDKTADPLSMYLSDIFTVPSSLAGVPALSMPVAQDQDGLPWGLQLVAPHFEEARMLRFASRIEAWVEAGS